MKPYKDKLFINGKWSTWWILRLNGKTYIGKREEEAIRNSRHK